MKEIIHTICEKASAPICDVASYLFASQSKFIRSLLIFGCAQDLLGHISDYTLKWAASIELMHTATLLHDDVIDQADMRRGKQATHHVFGAKQAILGGDFLLAEAFRLATSLGSSCITTLIEGACAIIEGESMQSSPPDIHTWTMDYYLTMVHKKTAFLFEIAIQESIPREIHSSTPRFQDYIERARKFGIGFQMHDDWMDYCPHRATSKSIGSDFLDGRITFPIILMLTHTQVPNSIKNQLIELFSDERLRTDIQYHWICTLINNPPYSIYIQNEINAYLGL